MSGLYQVFQKYKDKPIAIYGLGTETQRVLAELDGAFQVIGLLDGYRESGTLYGKPIISMKQAIENQTALILVVARPGSCKAIAKKIGRLCKDNQIALLDVRGKDLCDVKKAVYSFRENDGFTKDKLMSVVKAHDVVSVDLFDTLVMRRVLFPTDIFEIVNERLKEKGTYIEDFSGKRLRSEKYLSKNSAPTLVAIYQHMKDTYSLSEIAPGELAKLEWGIDCEMLVPRKEVCELLEKMSGQGKDIYIVSDTFYGREQLVKMLERCNITFFKDILASCEYGTGKTQSLFHELKERIHNKSCIHIGDDIAADIESAKRNGFAACQLYSGIELFEMAGYLGLWENINGLADRIKTGMLVAKLFNSPFQFEKTGKKISVSNTYDIGYLFFAPMISDFVIWFDGQVKRNKMQNVWFCARDGYLIKKLYDELKKDETSVYFLTSRIAAIRAGMESERDIHYVAEMKYSGTVQEQLKERFGIAVQKAAGTTEDREECLMDYSQEILEEAFVNRKNYEIYISSLSVKEGEIAFFDFVAKGTSQMYIGRLVKNHLKGFYFLQLEAGYMREKSLDIQPFYKAEELENSAIYDDYYILETMLTSPAPSVLGFDEKGAAHYAEETRTKEDIECFLAAQNGIFDYFKTYLGLCPETEKRVNKKLDEKLLSLIHNLDVLDKDFLGLEVEDPFFHRNTDMTDLI
ncbi:hypothetical protein C818_02133 [Lachnospiraceae bacterium MD308]|nr:hypothetical protein C818_02133 [Lachnospiraceae bacterium MD308]